MDGSASLPTWIEVGYSAETVSLSVLIAVYAVYVALDLVKRVRSPSRVVARNWLVAGTLVMGSGVWAMHFVGTLAVQLPFEVGYRYGATLLSWLAGLFASGLALWVASRDRVRPAHVVLAAFAMGAGLTAMHYIGMSAVVLLPAIRYDSVRAGALGVIAVIASYVALRVFIGLRDMNGRRAVLWQGLASVGLGVAISVMHYVGMSAVQIEPGAICRSLGAISGTGMGTLVGGASLLLLSQTLLNSMLDAHAQQRSAGMADSLSRANQQLKQIAFRDPLTQLPNRVMFEDRLQQAIARCDREGASLAVMFIDLDGFKPINDVFGHAAGDAVLREVGARLQSVVRELDTVARIGGDEFVLIVAMGAGTLPVAELAQRLNADLGRPVTHGARELRFSASIGIAVYPQDGPADKLLSNADSAMYSAKRAGSGMHRFFESGMDAGARAQLELLNEFRLALERDELVLYFQPKVDAHSGLITGAEALVRWRHPQRGIVGPVEFIPLAERFGLIGALGNWVIDAACRQMQAWRDEGLSIRVAINLSVHQLRQPDLLERIEGALRRHSIEPGYLTCEITESTAMDEDGSTLMLLTALDAAGVRISIDDFGTGYSSLSYLRKLPAAQLKIDRSFVNDIETSDDAHAIVEAVLRLAHVLGLKVVAEGVETEGQRALLAELGCDEIQGFLLGRPMPADKITDWAVNPIPNRPAFRPSVFDPVTAMAA